jgi:photosystem II stability/assembly factor-like uncharacterized protein
LLRFSITYPCIFVLFIIAGSNARAQWQALDTHTPESLRGLSAVNQSFVWASGTHGTYLFTEDGGKTWTTGQVPGAEALDFRGVVSFGFDAFLLAAGPGEQSRIYHTNHLGNHWDLQFTNHEPEGFLDCMAFFSDERHGVVVGDPVKGKFQILRTDDAGVSWRYADVNKMPAALPGEGAFAASNSCLTTQGKKNAWFVTGGSVARVFRSTDGGKNWKVSPTPIIHGPASAGIFSVAFQDARHGVIAGGDYAKPEQSGANLATTHDGGKSWKLVTGPEQKFFSAVAYVSAGPGDPPASAWLAVVGSSTSAFSKSGLKSWEFFGPQGFNAVSATGEGPVYAAGTGGRVMKAQLGQCGAPCR